MTTRIQTPANIKSVLPLSRGIERALRLMLIRAILIGVWTALTCLPHSSYARYVIKQDPSETLSYDTVPFILAGIRPLEHVLDDTEAQYVLLVDDESANSNNEPATPVDFRVRRIARFLRGKHPPYVRFG